MSFFCSKAKGSIQTHRQQRGDRMELRNLKTFQCAARTLNFNKKAELLNFSQPTISAQIQALEQEIGQPLFLRIGKATYLTPAGELLLQYADRILSTLQELDAEMKALSHAVPTLRIAAYETFCTTTLQPVLQAYIQQNSQSNLKIFACPTRDVVYGIEHNQYDIGIVSGHYEGSGIASVVLADDPIVLVVSSACQKQYTQQALFCELPFIQYNDHGPYGKALEACRERAGLMPASVIEFSSLEAAKNAALHHIGMMLITKDMVQQELRCGALVQLDLPGLKGSVPTCLLTQKEKQSWPLIQAFQSLLVSLWPASS